MDIEKEKRAIQYFRAFEPQTEPYYLCYSGGKDSDCIRILASLAGVKHDIVNNHTTVDAPETVRYIRSIPNIKISYPEKSMWQLIERKGMPPTRLVRYCCSNLKEAGGKGRVKITGVRWAESVRRAQNGGLVKVIGKPKTVERLAEEMQLNGKKNDLGGYVLNDDNDTSRRFVEMCYRTTSTMINPIVDWLDSDVWDFLRYYGCRSNPLYECGFKRIGCIGCPLGGGPSMKREFALYPKYKDNYIRAFDRMLAKRKERELPIPTMWMDGEHVFKWWVGDDPLQLTFDDFDKEWYQI